MAGDDAGSARGGSTEGPEAVGHDGFLIDGPAAQRFWDKSALGVPQAGNRLLLSAAEVLFCNRHRNLALPEGWESARMEQDGITDLLQEAAALEAVRTPGEKVVLARNLESLGLPETSSESTWALRWARRAFTAPAILMASPNKRSFSVSVVLPASGCEMIAKVRRLEIA